MSGWVEWRVCGLIYKDATLEIRKTNVSQAIGQIGACGMSSSAGWMIKLTTKERIIARDVMGLRHDGADDPRRRSRIPPKYPYTWILPLRRRRLASAIPESVCGRIYMKVKASERIPRR